MAAYATTQSTPRVPQVALVADKAAGADLPKTCSHRRASSFVSYIATLSEVAVTTRKSTRAARRSRDRLRN